MTENIRIVTERQLKNGLIVRWPDGSEVQMYFSVIRDRGDGTFDVEEPYALGESVPFVMNVKRDFDPESRA